MKETKFLIVSDIHLGSSICNAKALLELFGEYSYEKLIINGDLHEHGQIINGNDEQFEVVEYLRRHRDKVVYVNGNHDPVEESMIGTLIGVNPLKEYVWSDGNGNKLCAIHGHQFDKFCFVFSEPMIDKVFSRIVWLLKCIKISPFNIAQWLENFHDMFSWRVARRAMRWARRRGISVIICGHTHKAMYVASREKHGPVHYYNCGAWVDNCCSYITINKDFEIELHLCK